MEKEQSTQTKVTHLESESKNEQKRATATAIEIERERERILAQELGYDLGERHNEIGKEEDNEDRNNSHNTIDSEFNYNEDNGIEWEDYQNLEHYSEPEPISRSKKPVLFLDLDDVVLNTNKTLLTLLNTHFELQGEAMLVSEDIKEWNYFSVIEKINRILRKDKELQKRVSTKYKVQYPIGKDYIIKLLETSDFWVRVEFFKELEEMLEIALDKYEVIFLTQGSYINLTEKTRLLREKLNLNFFEEESKRFCRFYGLTVKQSKNDFLRSDFIAKKVKGRFCIQIDDNYNNLYNQCDLKIMVKNERDTDYNQIREHREDIYICDNLKEVKDIIKFYSEHDYRDIGE